MGQTRRGFLKKVGFMTGSASAISILPGSESTSQTTGTGKTIKPSELHFDSAMQAARAIRKHQISSTELTEHILKRIDQYNPYLNAIVTLVRDKALSKARTADKALAKEQHWGPLHGVPITIKDAFKMAGVICEAIEALRKAGANLEEGWPSNIKPADQYNTYRHLLSAAFASNLKDTQIDEMRKRAMKQDGSYEAIKALAWTAPHKHFQISSHTRMKARAAWQKYFRTHDAFLMPTAFVPAFPHDHSEPIDQRRLSTPEGERPYRDLLFWISFATLSGLPATNAPIGLTADGLPVGIQIVGPYLEDATPIDVAEKTGDVIGGFKPPKGY